MKLAAFAASLLLSGSAVAGAIDAIRSCRGSPMPPAGAPGTELIIAIDQTTPLTSSLKQMVADNVKAFLRPDNGFSIVVFSAYTQGHYTEVLASGHLEASLPLAVRDDTPKPVLAKHQQCMANQPVQAAQIAGNALRTAFSQTSSSIAKSDVLASLKAVSSLVAESRSPNKVVLLVSDMLENSSVSNFYADKGRAVRKIDVAKELKTAEENRLLGNFGGALVYVIGAGLLPEESANAKTYRDPKTMQLLADFWTGYLEKSNARLVEFGQPALLKPLR